MNIGGGVAKCCCQNGGVANGNALPAGRLSFVSGECAQPAKHGAKEYGFDSRRLHCVCLFIDPPNCN